MRRAILAVAFALAAGACSTPRVAEPPYRPVEDVVEYWRYPVQPNLSGPGHWHACDNRPGREFLDGCDPLGVLPRWPANLGRLEAAVLQRRHNQRIRPSLPSPDQMTGPILRRAQLAYCLEWHHARGSIPSRISAKAAHRLPCRVRAGDRFLPLPEE